MRWRSDAAAKKHFETSRPTSSRLWRLGRHVLTNMMCGALLLSTMPQQVWAQDSGTGSAATAAASDQDYSSQQLDALLAPIALYPDQLLTQILMASTYPDQITAANAWVQEPAHKGLTGDALEQALTSQDWDPSVKSLVPFPQVLETMSSNIDWTNQLGYAMSVQQSDVLASVQRLRRQAQEEGQLKSNEQQTVTTQGSSIVIVPAQPNVVYVPVYSPTVVYGTWPYPAYPPVYYPPPYGYYPGSALAAGLVFGAGVAITAGLWGWASPGWGHGNVNVNVNRYNNINVNRGQIKNSNWNGNWNANNNGNRNGNLSGNRPNGGRTPPAGPVGNPRPQRGMPANSIGRSSVGVPGSITKPPAGMGAGNRQTPGNPSMGQGGNRPGAGQASRPAMGQSASKPQFSPGAIPSTKPSPSTRPSPSAGMAAGNRANNRSAGPSAFNGMGDGRSASQFGNRGAQSQRMSAGSRGGGFGGGGGRAGGRAGGGGRR